MPAPTALARHATAVALGLAGLAATSAARADGSALRVDLVDPKIVKLDGVPREWPGGFSSLSSVVRGKAGKPDLDGKALVAYDATNVYVAADVIDDKLRGGGGDRVELVLGFPGGTVHSVVIFPGEPGKSAGGAKAEGMALAGAKVVEAPTKNGWSLEASIPWSAFPSAKTVRVGLRGAVFVHDVDDGNTVEGVIGTAPSSSYASLPSIATESEQALADGLLKQKGIIGGPKHSLIADVAGDSMKERVLVWDRFLVVLGPTFRKGTEYYYGDLGVDVAAGMLPTFETRELTGDDKAEIVLHKRFGSGGKWREMIQVLSFGNGEVPNPIFQHEVGLSNDTGTVVNDVVFTTDGGKPAIRIEAGTAKGLNAGNYFEKTETAFDALLLPWGTVKSQTYRYGGGSFSKASEEKQAATPAPAAPAQAAAALPKAPPPPSAAELLEKVYDLYKKERGAKGPARFDMAVDVAADKSVERVLLHDRDIVVFGKGFKGGTGYAFLTLSQFAAGADITDVGARDLTGDGKAELLVKGVLHASAPKEAGSGTVDREIFLVFQVQTEGIRRVFGAEIARAMGKKKVAASLAFPVGGKGFDIDLGPGKATDWTAKTYPFNEDTGPVGGLEPLVLPWSDKHLRYKWSGSAYTR